MYTQYFGLRKRPFDILPDSEFLFLSEQHKTAIDNIKFAILNRDSFVVVTGQVGVGKTTILKKIYKELGDSIEIARLTHTTLSPAELIQAILIAFHQQIETSSRVHLLEQLRLFLQQRYDQDTPVVIAVDEAQNLSPEALEELRLLTCIDADGRRLLTIVLIGQPRLNWILETDRMSNLRQRTRLRQHLENLSVHETFDYVRHRLAVVGGDLDRIFAPGTARIVYNVTAGNPRLINTLCDTALIGCAVRKADKITHEILREVLEELDWKLPWSNQGSTNYKMATRTGPPERLLLFQNGAHTRSISLDTLPFLIGRDRSNNLSIQDSRVRRRHAVIFSSEGKIAIERLSRSNILTINNLPIRKRLLKPNDLISIGSSRIFLLFKTSPLAEFHSVSTSPQDDRTIETPFGLESGPLRQANF
jgi:type II secretory pathway predicted ATPase ExeA